MPSPQLIQSFVKKETVENSEIIFHHSYKLLTERKKESLIYMNIFNLSTYFLR